MLDSASRLSAPVRTEFRRVEPVKEMPSLLSFDREVFRAADRFDATYWKELVSYWLLVDEERAGCCAFEANVDFTGDIRDDGTNARLDGSLLLATAGILPTFRGIGLGQMLVYWQICYARRHGFRRVVANVRSRNAAIIDLTRKLGFKVIRTTPGYYSDPQDATVVIELRLSSPDRD